MKGPALPPLAAPTLSIDPLSTIPLHIEVLANGRVLASATAFTISVDSRQFVVTNWHVLSGRHPTTKQPLSDMGAVPDTVLVWHHVKQRLGSWETKAYPLVDGNGLGLWRERQLPNGVMMDVAALDTPAMADVEYRDLDLAMSEADLLVSPSEAVSIIGFPFGRSANGKLPIWKTGHIASDLDIDVEGGPAFYIDATTKPGMSGSPVFAKQVGWVRSSMGISNGQRVRFLGVYSGRSQDDGVHERWSLGIVWKPSALRDLLT